MQKDTLGQQKIVQRIESVPTVGEESGTWEATKECLFVCGINFDISVTVRLAWQTVYMWSGNLFFVSSFGIYFFGQNPQEYIYTYF